MCLNYHNPTYLTSKIVAMRVLVVNRQMVCLFEGLVMKVLRPYYTMRWLYVLVRFMSKSQAKGKQKASKMRAKCEQNASKMRAKHEQNASKTQAKCS